MIENPSTSVASWFFSLNKKYLYLINIINIFSILYDNKSCKIFQMLYQDNYKI